ncbi:MAG: glucose-6-phosphate isomerase, partial [Actinopolymorphaceae bacterium]
MTDDALVVEIDRPTSGAVLRALMGDDVAPALARKDPTLWGPDATSEASSRLGWVDLPRTSRPLLAEIDALSAELRQEGLDHIALAGMGGSSLAPEVITATAGVPLTVLDSTDPAVVLRALADRLDRTVLVVSSKSGSTVETDSQRRAYLQAFAEAGIDGPSRIVVVTDPGSPLAKLAEDEGYRRVFLADPEVGGRYSALTAFGLVPAGLAGADVAALLDEADAILPALAESTPDNPALTLAAALAAAHEQGLEKVVLGDGATAIVGFPAWAEQLVAESTGKQGRGLLPVDVGDTSASTPGWSGGGAGSRISIGRAEQPVPGQVVTDGPLGAMFQLWETAVAIAGRVIGINPFDQPNVEEAKKQARALLDAPEAGDGMLAWTEGAVQVYGDPATLRGDQSLASLFGSLHFLVPETGYLALQAYLDR